MARRLQRIDAVILLNFSHPITAAQLETIVGLVGAIPEIRLVATKTDRERPLCDVAVELADAADLSPDAWQTVPLLINPPALAPIALAVLAEIHGRCGYFAPILNIRPVADAMPPRYEVAEIVNLNAIREKARSRR